MSTATLTSKGQITIPVAVRNGLNVKTGDRVEFRHEGGDFSDALVTALARDAGCSEVYTFDRTAAKRSGMTLLT